MNEELNRAVDSLEEKSLNELSEMTEENNEKNEKVIYDAQEEIKRIFTELRRWIVRNSEPEAIKENLEKAKEDTIEVLNKTREKAIEVSESEQFKKTLDAGKEFLVGTGALILEGLNVCKETLMKNDKVKDFVDKADSKLDVLRENKNLQDAAAKTYEATEKLNKAIFDGVKNFFEKK